MDEHRRITDASMQSQIHHLEIEVTRLQEKLISSEHALEIARVALKALENQRSQFVGRPELIAAIAVVVSIVVLVTRLIK